MKNIIGKKFGKLTVLELHHKEQIYYPNGTKNGFRYYYLCQCECGNKAVIRKDGLNSTVSCGCFRKEQAYKATFKKNNIRKSRIYKIYYKIKQRCYNKKFTFYKNYGGRGILLCNEWLNSFENFYNWSINNGYSDKLTIDRIDVNKNYCPENCRWVNMKTQQNNRRNNHYLKYNGKTKTLSEWGEVFGIKPRTIRARLKYGWDIEKAITTPVNYS